MHEVTPGSQEASLGGTPSASADLLDRTLESAERDGGGETARPGGGRPAAGATPRGALADGYLQKLDPGDRAGPAGRALLPGDPLGHFRIGRKLGEGGMGIVYAALDRERSQAVALKTLHRLDATGLVRMKNEFRAVADIVHPNLVSLYELFSIDDTWFFTMELIEGVSFLDHVRGAAWAADDMTLPPSWGATPEILDPCPPRDEAGAQESAPPSPRARLDADAVRRLRDALLQLATGVNALHAAGKLHRDLKPGNVMVTPTGRVVVLDFGLASSTAIGALDVRDHAVGTPAYMAPEQIWGNPPSPASDWYAVGVMLYQALTSRLPFEGSVVAIIKAKRSGATPPPPSELCAGVPPDLDALCLDLLAPHPEQRPTGARVLERLARDRISDAGPGSTSPKSIPPTSGSPGTSHGETPLVGRDAEVRALEEAYREAAGGEAVVACVHGRSGMGKTALVRRVLGALDRTMTRGEALVLEGRCYERESVPYKAFDSLIDALARHLRRLRADDVITLLPDGIHELARVFPVLQSVDAVADLPANSLDGCDPQELRRRAFHGLRALLGRLGAAHRLVVWIDDLQWGDRDSASLLSELLAPPGAPALLLVCTYRCEAIDSVPLVAEIFAVQRARGRLREIALGPLPREDAARLALAAMGRSDDAARQRAEQIAAESEGSPLFVEQLIRYADARDGEGAGAPAPEGAALTLERLILARLADLPAEARRLLEVVAVAGRPLPQRIALDAADLERDAVARGAVALLRSRHLVRTAGSRDRDAVEAYHDRIRETAVAHLDPDALARHCLRLALALEAAQAAEPDELAVLFQSAGELAKAGEYAAAAADRAAGAFAFDRAAELYRVALACCSGAPGGRAREAALQAKRADALVDAGRCAEAAPLYLAAAEGAPALQAIQLRGKAAEQLLVSGHIEEGTQVLRPALASVGLSYPATPGRALLSVIASFAELKLRGRRFEARPADRVPAADLARLDVCWGAAKGLLSFDSIRAASFLLRYVLLSLRVGEPQHVARALLFYGMMTVYEGAPRGIEEGGRIMEEAERIARRSGVGPYLSGIALGCKGTAAISAGRFREGVDLLEAGIALLKTQCNGVRWEVSVCVSNMCNGLLWLGDVQALARRAPAWLREAEQIGDLFGIVDRGIYCGVVEIAAGDAPAARACVRRALARWSRDEFTFQHWDALKLEVWCDLYEGDAAAAARRLDAAWPALKGSHMLRVRLILIDALLLRAMVAIAGATGPDARRRLRAAERDADALRDLRRDPSGAASSLIRAELAAARGDAAAAIAAFDGAAAGFEAAGMELRAVCARRREGELLGGEKGRALVAAVDARLRREGIADPVRWTAMFAPGLSAGRARARAR